MVRASAKASCAAAASGRPAVRRPTPATPAAGSRTRREPAGSWQPWRRRHGNAIRPLGPSGSGRRLPRPVPRRIARWPVARRAAGLSPRPLRAWKCAATVSRAPGPSTSRLATAPHRAASINQSGKFLFGHVSVLANMVSAPGRNKKGAGARPLIPGPRSLVPALRVAPGPWPPAPGPWPLPWYADWSNRVQ